MDEDNAKLMAESKKYLCIKNDSSVSFDAAKDVPQIMIKKCAGQNCHSDEVIKQYLKNKIVKVLAYELKP